MIRDGEDHKSLEPWGKHPYLGDAGSILGSNGRMVFWEYAGYLKRYAAVDSGRRNERHYIRQPSVFCRLLIFQSRLRQVRLV
jgi:hypothetical protein